MPTVPRPILSTLLLSTLLLSTLLLLAPFAHADDLQNRGNDPFFQISSAIANCPEPAGPRVTEAEWKRDAHHRIEHGNHCWLEGRCRLPNAFAYARFRPATSDQQPAPSRATIP